REVVSFQFSAVGNAPIDRGVFIFVHSFPMRMWLRGGERDVCWRRWLSGEKPQGPMTRPAKQQSWRSVKGLARWGPAVLDPYEETWLERIARFAEGQDGNWWRARMARRAAWRWRASAEWKNAQAWSWSGRGSRSGMSIVISRASRQTWRMGRRGVRSTNNR